MSIATVDFETEAIDGNPVWKPPVPVGVAIHKDGVAQYITGRNEMRAALAPLWDGELLFHNAPFDLSVAFKHLDLPWPKDPLKVHDSMYLLFLLDPYAKTYSLKPSAERYLNMPPTERDAVNDWIMRNVPEATVKTAGAFICRVPEELVRPYAIGDVVRTRQLFDFALAKVTELGMLEAYQREQKLMPIMCEASRRGIPIDREQLQRDAPVFEMALSRSTNRMFQLLGTEFSPSSNAQLISALEEADAVAEWVYTEKGSKSVARKNLRLKPEFEELAQLMDYRGMLETCLNTFIYPWIELSELDNAVHPEWNQTRGDRNSNDPNGTRSGRLSCSKPNFQNVPNSSDIITPNGFPALPVMRRYVKPPPGHVWVKRDFSSQEMRIMSHFAGGNLHDAYIKDPNVDPHAMVKEMIKTLLGIDLPRKHVKVTGFGVMYGMGVPKLSESLGVDMDMGKMTRNAYFTALPEVKTLASATKRRGDNGDPIKTWGGRLVHKEPHPDRNLSYKLLNMLIQGSAADQTKQAIIDWEESRKPTDLFMATVHDEVNIAVPEDDVAGGMFRLRVAMDADRFDVPFRSEGFIGPNWSEIQEYEA